MNENILPTQPTLDLQSRGVRIITGQEAKKRRQSLNQLIEMAEVAGFDEIILPALEPSEVYTRKAGPEILGQMYTFPDRKDRELCLRPEGTATIQLIADKYLSNRGKDVKLWYFERCYRYERPQAGRYREFFQFGIEWLSPSNEDAAYKSTMELAMKMVDLFTPNYEVSKSVKRGLAYYVGDGFEISVSSLGAQKQVCGGGKYAQGMGFALGFDRLTLIS